MAERERKKKNVIYIKSTLDQSKQRRVRSLYPPMAIDSYMNELPLAAFCVRSTTAPDLYINIDINSTLDLYINIYK